MGADKRPLQLVDIGRANVDTTGAFVETPLLLLMKGAHRAFIWQSTAAGLWLFHFFPISDDN